MEEYHIVWLKCHPHRTDKWLSERLAEGFDIHHLDGNHDNNDPKNLVLIEASDHMMLHGGRMMRRIGPVGKRGKRKLKGRKRKVVSKYIKDNPHSNLATLYAYLHG